MRPSELPVRHLHHLPRDGATATALHRSLCPSAQPPCGESVGHHIAPGDRIVFVAGAWRCQSCARRILEADR